MKPNTSLFSSKQKVALAVACAAAGLAVAAYLLPGSTMPDLSVPRPPELAHSTGTPSTLDRNPAPVAEEPLNTFRPETRESTPATLSVSRQLQLQTVGATGGERPAGSPQNRNLPAEGTSSFLGSTVLPTDPPGAAPRPAAQPLVLFPTTPTVLKPLDPVALGLSPTQAAVIDDARAQFAQDVGGPNVRADDPEYFQRWQRVARNSDAALRAQLGNAAVDQIELNLAQTAVAQSQQPGVRR